MRRGQTESAQKFRVIVGGLGDGFAFGWTKRNYVVVKARDEHVAVRVLHCGQQFREAHRGIGRPVAVVSAVQRMERAENGDAHGNYAAISEKDERSAALIDGPVGSDEQIASEKIFVCGNRGGEMRRAVFFLAFEDNL